MSTSWIRLATGFARHPKGLAAGPTGRHLFIVGLCWCGEYDTDGRIPGYALVTLAGDAGIPIDESGQWADKLVDCGLWEREPDGWQVHDWGQWQTTTEEREVKLNGNKERQARWRERQRAARNQPPEDVTRYEPVSNGHVTAPESESESESKEESELLSSSSSGPLGKPTPGPSDDDDDTVIQTINQLGEADHAKAIADGVIVRNKPSHRNACIQRRWPDLPAVRRLHAEHPTWTANQLAAHILNPAQADQAARQARINQALGIPR